MALSAKLAMRQGQTMVLTPQLLQAIKLLQMPNLELTQFIENELSSNPLLERAEEREDASPDPVDNTSAAPADDAPAEPGDAESRPMAETSTEAVRFSQISSVAVTRVVPDPASYVPGTTMPSEVVLTIGWNVLSHIELEPAHCGDESCEADHGYTGTMTADDLTMRVSEGADGEDAVRQVLAFAQALSEATST